MHKVPRWEKQVDKSLWEKVERLYARTMRDDIFVFLDLRIRNIK